MQKDNNILSEATVYTTKQEDEVKADLITILRKQGRNQWADLIEHYPVKLYYPTKEEVESNTMKTIAEIATAGPNANVITINALMCGKTRADRINDTHDTNSVFKQLSVLIRHEVGHSILAHQIRYEQWLEKKFGKEKAEHLKKSPSFMRELANITADTEDSIVIYNKEDEQTIRDMQINTALITDVVGKIDIGGIVGSDIRSEWKRGGYGKAWGPELHELLDEYETEIEKAEQNLLKTWNDQIKDFDYDASTYYAKGGHNDWLEKGARAIRQTYSNINNPSVIPMEDVDAFIQADGFKNVSPEYKEILQGIWDTYNNATYTDEDIQNLLKSIPQTGTFDDTKIKKDNGEELVLYSPEEKALGEEAIKKIYESRHLYEIWSQKMKDVLENADPPYTPEEIQKLTDLLKKEWKNVK